MAGRRRAGHVGADVCVRPLPGVNPSVCLQYFWMGSDVGAGFKPAPTLVGEGTVESGAKSMTKLIDALTARTRFGELMDEVDADQVRFVVIRRGKAKVLIMSVCDYLTNVVKQPELLTRIQLSGQTAGLNKITEAEIEAELPHTGRPTRNNVVFLGPK
jgi:hypothetical protein